MNKPDVNEVLEIKRMKIEAVALYVEIDNRIQAICDKYGAQRYDYDLGEADDEGKRYLKFEVTDNIRKMQDGEDVWKSVPFKPVSFSIGMLKNCPRALKP